MSNKNTVKVRVYEAEDDSFCGDIIITNEEWNHFSKCNSYPAEICMTEKQLDDCGVDEETEVYFVEI